LIGMLEKFPYQAKPVRYEYRPTPLGHSLQPVLKEILKFGQTHLSS
jgi:DNA-binding HxlR family transcriptional regulator